MGRQQLLLAFKQSHWSSSGILFVAPHILRFAVVACRESNDSAPNIEATYGFIWSLGTLLHLYVKQYCTTIVATLSIFYAANVCLEVILPSFLFPSRPGGISNR